MLAILHEKRVEIAALCRAYGITRLEVFGSAVTDEFDPERSDIDFFAYFADGAELGWWSKRFYEMTDEFVALLGRDVDIVSPEALADPFYRHVANLTRTVILDEAEDGAAA